MPLLLAPYKVGLQMAYLAYFLSGLDVVPSVIDTLSQEQTAPKAQFVLEHNCIHNGA